MDNLIIVGTAHTPDIIFDFDKHHHIISGRSTPEDCDIYYLGPLRWLEVYTKEIESLYINNKIRFHFRFEYYNSTSIRYLHTIMLHVENITKIKPNTIVIWEYDSDDEYLEEMGKEFELSYDINIEFKKNEIKPRKLINRKDIIDV